MKRYNRLYLVWLLPALLSIGLVGCQDRSMEEITYKANVPVYANTDFLEAEIQTLDPQPLKGSGKIHMRGNFLFIVDNFIGVHVFDNSNPSSPVNLAYLRIPGVIDIATSGTTLYADSYKDLVTIDISDLQNIFQVDRDENVFKAALPPVENSYPIADIDPEKGVVIGWNVQTITEEVEVNNQGWFGGPESVLWNDQLTSGSQGGGNRTMNFGGNGVSGSLARFIAFGEQLYVVNGQDIRVFDLSDVRDPKEGAVINTWRDIETLFPAQQKLFVGTTTGMLIYGLENPSSPNFISNFNHATSCDPVVVEGKYAYVTLRGGSACGGWSDQLDVIDIENIESPSLVATYPMTSPGGLGVKNDVIFICDGPDGLKIYDAADKHSIDQNQLAHYPDVKAYDVIPLGDVLMAIAEDGLYQYDFSNPENIQLLSTISTPVQ